MALELRLPLAHFPAPAQQLRAFLQAAYVPVNLRREGEGWVFDISAKVLKKKALLHGDCREEADLWVAELVIGPKFDLRGYLQSFPGPSRVAAARVCVLRTA